MRGTTVLFRQHLGRAFKKLWAIRSKRKVIDLGIPSSIQHIKDHIIDATKFAEEPLKERERLTFVEPYDHVQRREARLKQDWHGETSLLFDRETKLREGIPQILLLLKTVLYEGLPSSVEDLVGKMDFKNQDELVKRKIMECTIWDGRQDKLPKKLDVLQPGHVFPRDYGITNTRKILNLQSQILHLCALATSKHCTYIPRSKHTEPKARVFLEKEKDQYLFSIKSDYSIMAQKPLDPFGPSEETETMKLPNIFPLRHMIDLKVVNNYKDEELLLTSPQDRHLHVHSIGISHKTIRYWHQPQKLVRGIASCFTFAAAQARSLYGREIGHLPKPIALHGICCDEKHYSVISYQLNTLNLEGEDGLKNQVWVDGPHALFESCDEIKGVVNYNPEVFRKIVASYTNGLM